jgi:hypothetical protein
MSEARTTMIMTGSGEAKTARDGRSWTLRPGRPTDGRGLARLFAAVRREGRWLITTPGAVSEPSEAFWISEMIRADEHLVLVAESDAEVVGNVLVTVDRGVATEHIGVLSITIADGPRFQRSPHQLFLFSGRDLMWIQGFRISMFMSRTTEASLCRGCHRQQ